MNLAKIHRILEHHLPTLGVVNFKRCFPKLFYKLRINPWIASLLITHRCNFNCITCGVRNFQSDKELTTQEWKNIIRQLKEIGIHSIIFTGGEPLLRNDLLELVYYIKSLKISEIGIITNGYLLDGVLSLKLINAGIKYFTISVDALGNKFDKIRKGSFKKVLENCQILSRVSKNKNIKVIISFTIMKDTLDSLLEVVELASCLGFSVFLNLLDYTPYIFLKAKNDKLWINSEKQKFLEELIDKIIEIKIKKPALIVQSFSSLLYIKDYFKDPLQKNIPCSKIFTRIFIDPQGKIYPGCLSKGNIGNLLEIDLREIIFSKSYLEFQVSGFFKNCPGCSCGYQYDLKYNISYLLKDLGWKIKYLYRFLNYL